MTYPNGSGAPAGFADARQIVQDAAAFLASGFDAHTVAGGAGCGDLAGHAGRQAAALGEERPSRLRVLVLGEFKAGKSSLINVLVGKKVAATDVGELTAAVCRILPAADAPEHVVLWSPKGAPVLRFAIPEFLAAAIEHGRKARSGAPSPLDGYTRADLYVRTALPVELVDTPGLGAAQRNEQQAMDALGLADLVLLTIDCDNLGGARDAALMDRLQVSGQPLVVAVTKTDLLDEEEREEVLDYVARTYGLPPERLFPVSARRFEETGADPGLTRLRDHLAQAAPERAALRDRALLAQACDLAAELAAGLELVVESVSAALQDMQESQESNLILADTVTRHICTEVGLLLRQKLQAEAEGLLSGAIHNRASRLTEQEFTDAMAQSVRNLDTRPFWESVQTRLESRYREEWTEGVRRQLAALNANLEQRRRDMKEETSALSAALAREEKSRFERKGHAVGTAVTAGATAVVMLVVGFPLLLAAAAVAPAAWAYYEDKMRTQREPPLDEVRFAVHRAVSEWVDEYVSEVMTDFGAKLLRENEAVAYVASETYGRERSDFPGNAAELAGLLGTARRHLAGVSALTAAPSLLTKDA